MCYRFEYSGGPLGTLAGGNEHAEAEAGYRKSPWSIRVQTWSVGHAMFEYGQSGHDSIAGLDLGVGHG